MQGCSARTTLRFRWLHGEVLDGEKMTLMLCHGPVKPNHRLLPRSMMTHELQAHDDDYDECQRSPCGGHDGM